MNTAVKTLTARGLSVRTLSLSINRQQVVLFLLFTLVLLSAFALVYVKDLNRRLTSQLESVQTENVQLHNDWTQLLLNKSNLANQSRVSQLAHKDFHMSIPAPKSVVMIHQ